jgi:hypothetical protein
VFRTRPRRFVLPFVAAAALIAPAAAQAAAPGTVWTADASQPMGSEWASLATQTECGIATTAQQTSKRVSVVSDTSSPSPTGRYYRTSITDGDICYSERSEIAQGNPVKWTDRLFSNGQDRWISFAVRLAPNFPTNAARWQTLAQWKQTSQYGGEDGSPVLAMEQWGGQWRINHTSWDERDQWNASQGSHSHAFAPAVAGRWVKFSMHVVFAASKSSGVFELYGDMGDGRGWRTLVPFERTPTLKLDTVGTSRAATNTPIPSHTRIGIYRDAASYSANTYADYAGFNAATTRAAAEANAFKR